MDLHAARPRKYNVYAAGSRVVPKAAGREPFTTRAATGSATGPEQGEARGEAAALFTAGPPRASPHQTRTVIFALRGLAVHLLMACFFHREYNSVSRSGQLDTLSARGIVGSFT